MAKVLKLNEEEQTHLNELTVSLQKAEMRIQNLLHRIEFLRRNEKAPLSSSELLEFLSIEKENDESLPKFLEEVIKTAEDKLALLKTCCDNFQKEDENAVPQFEDQVFFLMKIFKFTYLFLFLDRKGQCSS